LLREAAGSDAEENSEEDNTWNGIQDVPTVEPIDHEAEYVDEDKYTTVTIEAVDVSKEGLSRITQSDDSEEDTQEAPKLVENKEKPKKLWPKKPKKKKFRYETKVERKMSRAKQKSGNKAKADARRGND
jgi:ribosomal RNA-processing protein 17